MLAGLRSFLGLDADIAVPDKSRTVLRDHEGRRTKVFAVTTDHSTAEDADVHVAWQGEVIKGRNIYSEHCYDSELTYAKARHLVLRTPFVTGSSAGLCAGRIRGGTHVRELQQVPEVRYRSVLSAEQYGLGSGPCIVVVVPRAETLAEYMLRVFPEMCITSQAVLETAPDLLRAVGAPLRAHLEDMKISVTLLLPQDAPQIFLDAVQKARLFPFAKVMRALQPGAVITFKSSADRKVAVVSGMAVHAGRKHHWARATAPRHHALYMPPPAALPAQIMLLSHPAALSNHPDVQRCCARLAEQAGLEFVRQPAAELLQHKLPEPDALRDALSRVALLVTTSDCLEAWVLAYLDADAACVIELGQASDAIGSACAGLALPHERVFALGADGISPYTGSPCHVALPELEHVLRQGVNRTMA